MWIKHSLRVCCLFVCISVLIVNTALGTIITFEANYEFSGGTAPVGTAPWLTAVIDDHGSSGSVTLTLTATNLTGDEDVKEWYLNLDPAVALSSLNFSAPTKVGSFTTPTISKGTDGFKADGDGYYDINFAFATDDGLPTRFTAGDSVTYTVTGPSITANSFNFTSTPGGGTGTYTMAAHVQNTGTGGTGSGWVAPLTIVPEPSTIILLGMAAFGFAFAWRRKR